MNVLIKYIRANPFALRVSQALYHKSRLAFAQLVSSLRGVKYFPPEPGDDGRYQSQFGQDAILERLNLLRQGGRFLEVGANNPIRNSNTYYLEHHWKYTGVSIDPLDYSSEYRKSRPNTVFLNNAIDSENSHIELIVPEKREGWEDQLTSKYNMSDLKSRDDRVSTIRVQTTTIADVVKRFGEFDILFIDVEGMEPEVLKSNDWEAWRPFTVVIENNGDVNPRGEIRAKMKQLGYKQVAQIGSTDEVYVNIIASGQQDGISR